VTGARGHGERPADFVASGLRRAPLDGVAAPTHDAAIRAAHPAPPLHHEALRRPCVGIDLVAT